MLLASSPAVSQGKSDTKTVESAQSRALDTLSCGSLDNPVGPFDYRKHVASAKNKEDILWNIETNHFNEGVESLRGGMTGNLGSELSYVLRAFPNHHRALLALYRLAARSRSETIAGLRFPVTCWFARAVDFAPDDERARELYALHLYRRGMRTAALDQYRAALDLGANDANTFYNLGLLYFDMKQYDKALEFARKAYAAGFQLPGLREKLSRAGQWRE
jgi:tetratricopeptide (TPR) repeat protein